MKKLIATLTIGLAAMLTAQSVRADFCDEQVYVYQQGQIVFIIPADEVGRIDRVGDNDILAIYDSTQTMRFSALAENIDSITFSYVRPKADMLDVVFNVRGEAEDVSPMKMKVEAKGSDDGKVVYYSNTYKRYVVNFKNAWGGTPTAYYKASYAGNQAFKDKLCNSHTLEVLCMPRYEGTIENKEAKPFSNHQGGGTGFLVSKISAGNYNNELTFTNNIKSQGYRDVHSGIIPQNGVYYHMVAVWDKQAGVNRLYVNGQLCGETAANGELNLPAEASQWFGIGTDSNTGNGELSWNGEIVLARVYDAALTGNDVTVLWSELADMQKHAPEPLVTDVEFMSGLPVKAGGTFEIGGHGWQEGDILRLINLTTSGTMPQDCKVTPLGTDSMQMQLTTKIQTARYRMLLMRGSESQDLGTINFTVVDKMPKPTLVNAHRGFWNTAGSCQNSRTSLRKAFEIGAVSSECDIWLSSDDSIMINHDASLGGVTIQTSTYEQCRNLKLSNGELIPMLVDLLTILKETDTQTKLLIEVKKHSNDTRTIQAAMKAMDLVEKMGLKDRVEYCSFSWATVKAIIEREPTATVCYINGDKTPDQLAEFGLQMNYSLAVMRNHPEWFARCKELGIRTCPWTLNDAATMIEMCNAGADVWATDYPLLGFKIRNYYLRHQDE